MFTRKVLFLIALTIIGVVLLATRGSNKVHASGYPLPNFELPYHSSQEVNWSGGPHQWGKGPDVVYRDLHSGSGLDFAMGGQSFEVAAIAEGEVVYAGDARNGLGLQVAVKHSTGGSIVIYGHLKEIYSPILDSKNADGTFDYHVSPKYTIGYAGCSGMKGCINNSVCSEDKEAGLCSVHLHVELRDGSRDCCGERGDGGNPIGWHSKKLGNYRIYDIRPNELGVIDKYPSRQVAFNYDGVAVRISNDPSGLEPLPYDHFSYPDFNDNGPIRQHVYTWLPADFVCNGEMNCETDSYPGVLFAGKGEFGGGGILVSDTTAPVNQSQPNDATPTPYVTSEGIEIVSVSSHEVSPGQTFAPTVVIRSVTEQLDTSDYLHAVPEDGSNTFGAWPIQGVHHLVSAGNNYTFEAPEHELFVMTAPQQTGTYQSVWRMNVNNVDVGPQIVILITVRNVEEPHPIDYWNMDVYTSKDLSGSVAFNTTFTDQYIFKNWGIDSPSTNIPVDNWSAQFVREINFPGGEYRFHCQHDDGCRMYIDGEEKLNAWWDSSFDGHDWTGTLTAGFHEIKVEYYDQGGGARLDFWWQGPGFFPLYPSCEPDQWCAEYYGNDVVAGIPPIMRNEGSGNLDIGWGYGSPASGIPNDYFSARFRRNLPFACGKYRFHITADDGDRFYIDDQLILDEWTTKAQYTTDVDVQLAEGDHKLTFHYREATGDAVIRVTWDQLTTCAPYTGDLVVVSGQTMYVNSIASSVEASGTTATVSDSANFYVGDTVLLHQTQDPVNAGLWETATIQSISGSMITFATALGNSYNSSAGHAQIVKIPQYNSVTVQNGGTLTAFPWNGSTGGILVFESSGAVTIDGTVDVTGKGFRGGEGSKRTLNQTGRQGESYTGLGATCSSNGCNVNANNHGGGGSGGTFASGSGGGAGGSFATQGSGVPTGNPIPGTVYGNNSLTNLYFGSGGGGGYEDGNSAVGGNGGSGGGIILISAPNIAVSGNVIADGAAGQGTASYAGGGGSGGSIYLNASSSLAIGTDKVLARGGAAGATTSGWQGGNGGAGGTGRIWVGYCGTFSGSTNPVVNVEQSNCAPPTPVPTNTPTPDGSMQGVELLTEPWHLEGNNGSAELYQGVPTGVLQGKDTLRITYDLHGLQALGGDASAIIFDQNGWQFVSLADYGQNGLDGQQTVDIPLADFSGLNPNVAVGTLHTRFWNSEAFVVDIVSIVAFTSDGGTPEPTYTPTPMPTPIPTSTPTPDGSTQGVELLTEPWHLEGSNGSAELYQGVPTDVLQGKDMLRITYNLHGLQALGGDASAIIFDQNGWQFVSLADYGQNGLDGQQTVDIPLADFSGLNPNAAVGTLHTRFWSSEAFVADIVSIVAFTSDGGTSEPTYTPTPMPTPIPTSTPTVTPTPDGSTQGVELLTEPWHLEGNNGSAELYQGVPANALQGKDMLRITYNLHGLQALGGDASAIIFDQNGWQFVSLADYGQNGLDGQQTVDIPLVDFSGLNPNVAVGTLHTRFWNSEAFVVDIVSIVAFASVSP